MKPGPRNLITDVPGLRVGQASDAALKSGVSVLTADAPFVAGVSVMGGAPGTRDTELLAPDKSVAAVDALVLSGGSAPGLAAADGVSSALKQQGRGFAVGPHLVPIVPAAILFDLGAGGNHGWSDNPYPALGRAAFAAASETFELGSHGAGTGATTARLKGGLGSASVMLADGTCVAALVAANPVGEVIMADGPHFWAAPFELGAEFGSLGVGRHDPGQGTITKLSPGSATTIAIVATDAALDKSGCTRMAIAAQDGIARAVVPSHSPMDGDLVFALSTGARTVTGPAEMLAIGHAAACCLSRAIARAIYAATPAPGDLKPCWSTQFSTPGL